METPRDEPETGGTYAPPRPRRVLLSDVAEFRVADLPRRTPIIEPPWDLDEFDGICWSPDPEEEPASGVVFGLGDDPLVW